MNKKTIFSPSQQLPILIIITGFLIGIFPDFLFGYNIHFPFELVSQSLIILGFLYYGFKELQERLFAIEKELEIDRESVVMKAKIIESDYTNDFLNEIRKKSFIYKASIYLPSASIENIFFIQNLVSSAKFDSQTRVIINLYNAEEVNLKNLQNLQTKFMQQVEMKIVNLPNYQNFVIIIIDTDVWIINDYGIEIKKHLLFNLSSFNEHGKSFIELFNRFWNSSDILTNLSNK